MFEGPGPTSESGLHMYTVRAQPAERPGVFIVKRQHLTAFRLLEGHPKGHFHEVFFFFFF